MLLGVRIVLIVPLEYKLKPTSPRDADTLCVCEPRDFRRRVRYRPTVKINKRSEKPTVYLLAQREGFEPSCAFGTN